MDIAFLILFGLSVLAANAMIVGIERFANAVKDEFAIREDKKMTQKTVTLDEFLNKRGDFVKQVVYKIDGDYVGDIKGENVTVILMGNGDFEGNVNSKDGTVFLNKGNFIGDIKANKVLMPNKKTYYGRRGIVVRCPHCDELYTQSLSINGHTSEDDANLVLDVKINVEEPLEKSPDTTPTCHSCKYYSSYGNCAYYYCEKLKDNFCNPYNTCGRYMERT